MAFLTFAEAKVAVPPLWTSSLVGKYFKIPLWNYNSITIIQQHLIIYDKAMGKTWRNHFPRNLNTKNEKKKTKHGQI